MLSAQSSAAATADMSATSLSQASCSPTFNRSQAGYVSRLGNVWVCTVERGYTVVRSWLQVVHDILSCTSRSRNGVPCILARSGRLRMISHCGTVYGCAPATGSSGASSAAAALWCCMLPAGSVDCIQLRTCHVGLHPAEDLSCWQHTVGITAASERCLTVFHIPASTKLAA